MSAATHSVVVGQVTPASPSPSGLTRFVTDHVPPLGSVDTYTLPVPASLATHSVVVGHEIASNPSEEVPTGVVFHASGPPAGSVVVSTSAFALTAAQNDVVGHEIEVRAPPLPIGCGALQESARFTPLRAV
jgi:hypothetical protein